MSLKNIITVIIKNIHIGNFMNRHSGIECWNSKLQPCLVIETAKFTPCISIIQNNLEANTQHSLCVLFLPPLVLHQEQCNYVCSRNRSWHTAQEASNQTREPPFLITYSITDQCWTVCLNPASHCTEQHLDTQFPAALHCAPFPDLYMCQLCRLTSLNDI